MKCYEILQTCMMYDHIREDWRIGELENEPFIH